MAFSLSPRENYLLCMHHQPHEYTPANYDAAMAGLFLPIERGPNGSGTDAFGIHWVSPASGGAGSAIPQPGEFMLKDITKWKEVVRIPDLSQYDWAGLAAAEEPMLDREHKVVEVWSSNSIYERMAALMGFEECLLALALEPEASFELLSALADWKIEMIKYFAKYYRPDEYVYFDDVATERQLTMSPETYRTLIKPLHTKMVQACKDLGIIPVQHTCGNASLIVQDMIDEGNDGWNAVQSPHNDVAALVEKYGDHFVFIGGYNTTGAPGQPSATEEMVRAEVRRCFAEYGKFGQGYIFSGLVLTEMNPNDPFDMGAMNGVIVDEAMKIRAEAAAAA
ncbi:MAG: hypothetical protein FWC59_02455 [Actinomycetia bacterium]|nr:hypothetical protein [Actinomycetes bacterium]